MGHEGMKSSLVSREIIADSIEVSMRGIVMMAWSELLAVINPYRV